MCPSEPPPAVRQVNRRSSSLGIDKLKRETAVDNLRRKAEERLLSAEKTGLEHLQPDGDSQRLCHELEVSHIELEIQNEELVRARDETDIALEKFADLFESGPVGFLTLTRDGTVKAVSLSSANLLKIDRAQLLGKRFGLFVNNESLHAFADLLDKTFTDFTKVMLDVAIQPEGNAPIFVQLLAKAAASGQECNVALIDITQRKRAEEALSLSEQRYRAVVEDQTELIFRYRPDGSYSFVNAVFRGFFRKTDEEIIGQGWHHDVVAEDIPMVEERLMRLCPEHPVVEVENRVIAGSGEIRLMQFVNHGFFDEKGRLIETQSVGRDITEHNRMEEAVRESESDFRTLAETVPQIVWATSADGRNTFLNHRWVDYTGLTPEESSGHGWITPFHPDDKQYAWEAWQRATVRNEPYSLECRLRRADGNYRWWLIRGAPVQNAKGEILKWFGTCTDIEEIKQNEKALTAYARRLIILEEDLRKRIAADLHDDIAQTLTALGLNLSYLSNHLKDGQRENLDVTVADSRKLVKDVSRSVRNLMVELHPHQLEEFGLVAALRPHVEQYANRTGFEAVLDADVNFPRLSAKKETALYRIIQEALQNILKHATATKVTITLSRMDGGVRLTVTDNGKGFVPEAGSPQPTGSGWGLTNMRERAELIGGRFRVHSVVGEGTTVEVEIKGTKVAASS